MKKVEKKTQPAPLISTHSLVETQWRILQESQGEAFLQLEHPNEEMAYWVSCYGTELAKEHLLNLLLTKPEQFQASDDIMLALIQANPKLVLTLERPKPEWLEEAIRIDYTLYKELPALTKNMLTYLSSIQQLQLKDIANYPYEVALLAMKQTNYIKENFKECPVEFWTDELLTAYIERYPWGILDLPKEKQTDSLCVLALEIEAYHSLGTNYTIYPQLQNQSEYVSLNALKQDINHFQSVPKQTEAIAKQAIQLASNKFLGIWQQINTDLKTEALAEYYLSQFRYRPEAFLQLESDFQTQSLLEKAIGWNYRFLNYVKKPTLKLCKTALNQNIQALALIKNQTLSMIKYAISIDRKAVLFVKEGISKEIEQALYPLLFPTYKDIPIKDYPTLEELKLIIGGGYWNNSNITKSLGGVLTSAHQKEYQKEFICEMNHFKMTHQPVIKELSNKDSLFFLFLNQPIQEQQWRLAAEHPAFVKFLPTPSYVVWLTAVKQDLNCIFDIKNEAIYRRLSRELRINRDVLLDLHFQGVFQSFSWEQIEEIKECAKTRQKHFSKVDDLSDLN